MSIRVPVLTPFASNGRIDHDALAAFIQWLDDRGISEFWAPGTTGEFPYLTFEEKLSLIDTVVPRVRSLKKRVLIGIYDGNPRCIIELATQAWALGAHGFFLMTPIYLKLKDREIVNHYRQAYRGLTLYAKVYKKTNIPQLYAYTIPTLSGNDISFPALSRLVGAGILAGIKDSSRDEARLEKLIKRFRSRIEVCIGTETRILWSRKQGAHGCVVGLANAFPELALAAWNGDQEAAIKFAEISQTLDALSHTSKIPAIKYLASARSGIPLGVRAPFLSPTRRDKATLDRILEEFSRQHDLRS